MKVHCKGSLAKDDVASFSEPPTDNSNVELFRADLHSQLARLSISMAAHDIAAEVSQTGTPYILVVHAAEGTETELSMRAD